MHRNLSRSLLATAGAIATGLLGTTDLAAQAATYTACRVPGVGAIYMIRAQGTPTGCLEADHVEFSWTEGGEPADGSITEAKLDEEAVTSAKIADGTIETVDIADAAITLAKLDPDITLGVGDSELGLEVVLVRNSDLSGQFDNVLVTCPAGKVAVGGGFDLEVSGTPNPGSAFHATESAVTDAGTGWRAVGYWPSPQSGWGWAVTVICIIDS